jgi:hypothetical protein
VHAGVLDVLRDGVDDERAVVRDGVDVDLLRAVDELADDDGGSGETLAAAERLYSSADSS